jgi:hypothetical protein
VKDTATSGARNGKVTPAANMARKTKPHRALKGRLGAHRVLKDAMRYALQGALYAEPAL